MQLWSLNAVSSIDIMVDCASSYVLQLTTTMSQYYSEAKQQYSKLVDQKALMTYCYTHESAAHEHPEGIRVAHANSCQHKGNHSSCHEADIPWLKAG